ncbi:hypothetical protein [Corynebacterium sp. Marseille-P4321]|uniref:hypothetical protein n=1 Tax=Corynebacterium sp. Marseille-P4321 TaxID=2736603 RepID=UPI001C37E03D|nr:hypothetical protein [Corynebacterium sp. Marseille-P4321]
MAIYVVPSHGLGPTRTVKLRGVSEHLLDDAAVTLTCPFEGDPEVLLGDEPIGTIDAADLAEYPELGWIEDSDLAPQLTARRQGDEAVVELPAPGLMLPHNAPPKQPWVFLDQDAEPVEVALTAERGLPDAPAQLLCTFELTDAGDVTVAVDGAVVGELPGDAAAALIPTLDALGQRGLTPVARGNANTESLTVTAGSLHNLVERDEVPVISPLPPLDAEAFRATSEKTDRPAPAKLEELDTGFFATVDAEAAAIAADTEEHSATTEGSPRRGSRGPLVALGATATALALTAAGAMVINATSDRDQDSASAFIETVTSEQAPTETTEPEETTAASSESESPEKPESSKASDTAEPAEQQNAPAPAAPAPAQQAPRASRPRAPAGPQAPRQAPRSKHRPAGTGAPTCAASTGPGASACPRPGTSARAAGTGTAAEQPPVRIHGGRYPRAFQRAAGSTVV